MFAYKFFILNFRIMAKFKSTTFGSISGKHGTAVAVITRDGKNYMRLHRDPSNPRTEKQVRQRTKFAFTVQALRPFMPLLRETARGSHGMKTLRSHAFRNAVQGDYPDYEFNYEQLLFTYGTLDKLLNVTAVLEGENATLSWDFIQTMGSRGDDQVNVIFFNEVTGQTIHKTDWAMRSEETAPYSLPATWSGAQIYCWVYLKQGNSRSDNQLVEWEEP